MKDDIDAMCKKIEDSAVNSEPDASNQGNIRGNMKNHREMLKSFLDIVAKRMREFEEDKHYSNIGSGSGIVNLHTRLNKLKTDVYNMRLNDKEVHYSHTYNIIRKEIIENGKPITFAKAHPTWPLMGEEPFKEVSPGFD